VILAAAAGTPLKVSLAATAASLLLLIVVFELIRSRRLRERYALLWLLTGLVLLALSAWRGGLNTIAGWVGVQTYPPAVLFAVALLFVLAVLLHYSTVISKLSDENVILAQRLALLEFSVSENVGVSEKLSARDDRREPGPAAATAPAERER
jgi:cell division protein FtsW (lipid II flippase)